MKSNACGVDFGTSNSTVGWLRSDAPTLLPLEDGKVTLPSVIFFHAEDPLVSYGRAALTDYLAGYEGRLMRSLKSLLGTSMMDDSTEVMGQAMPFRKLLSHFIGELKGRAERAAGRTFTSAVRCQSSRSWNRMFWCPLMPTLHTTASSAPRTRKKIEPHL